MDVLHLIEKQIELIKKYENSLYLESILTHIRRAEFYYDQGKIDDYYYNDVIYRSNQAFEGALKESFKILADKSQEEVIRVTPNEIEKYFESNDVFRERVLQLFKNYRQQWRNKSTHDYKLFFDSNEAFIALMSVNSFVHLLLNQIQEQLAYNEQQVSVKSNISLISKVRSKIASKTKPTDKVIQLITEFSKLNSENIYERRDEIKEFELIGLFHAFIKSVDKSITIEREPKIEISKRNFRPDFIILVDDVPFILEFKNLRSSGSIQRTFINQLLIYLQTTGIEIGIIYYARFSSANPSVEVKDEIVKIKNKEYHITTIST